MEDLFIALALLAFALFNWVFQKGGLLDKIRGRGAENEPDPDEDLSEEERHRKFMEALGLPTTEAPPPPIAIPVEDQPPPVPEPKEAQTAASKPEQRKDDAIDYYQQTDEDEFSWDLAEQPNFDWQSSDATVAGLRNRMGAEDAETSLSREERDALARVDSRGGVQHERLGNADYAFHKAEVSKLKKILFNDRQALRRAILAKEILDQPRGLQEIPGPITIYSS